MIIGGSDLTLSLSNPDSRSRYIEEESWKQEPGPASVGLCLYPGPAMIVSAFACGLESVFEGWDLGLSSLAPLLGARAQAGLNRTCRIRLGWGGLVPSSHDPPWVPPPGTCVHCGVISLLWMVDASTTTAYGGGPLGGPSRPASTRVPAWPVRLPPWPLGARKRPRTVVATGP